jgi:putative flavoprotein involved in K+ transport
MAAPRESLPVLRHSFQSPLREELDFELSGITNVIWGTSYAFDFSLVRLPVLDKDGFPVQRSGVTKYPGLYFVGLPWLPKAKSGLLYGVGETARHIAQDVIARSTLRYGVLRQAA